MRSSPELEEVEVNLRTISDKRLRIRDSIARAKAGSKALRTPSDWQRIQKMESDDRRLGTLYEQLLRKRGSLGSELQRWNAAFVMAAKLHLPETTFDEIVQAAGVGAAVVTCTPPVTQPRAEKTLVP